MNILFIHRFFPGQFKSLIAQLASCRQHRIVAIGRAVESSLDPGTPSITHLKYNNKNTNKFNLIHPYLIHTEMAVRNGQGVAQMLTRLKAGGFTPDIILAHIGWGEALYCKDVFPGTPLLGYCEFYYHSQNSNADFDPEFPMTQDDALRIRTQNAPLLLSLTAIDCGISPTPWQKSLFPLEYQNRIEVLHEGVDTDVVAPDPKVALTLPDGRELHVGQEIITYAARNLEPYRGFHSFMRAVPEICRRRPHCLILIEGGDGVSYSPRLPQGQTYRERMLMEAPVDPRRVIFLGNAPFERHLRLLQISAVHIYLTVPFVLSWSLLEAMATQTVVIASDTPPVRDVIEDGRNGLLVDFFSPRRIADRVDEVLDHPDRMTAIARAAREYVQRHYSVRDSLDRYQEIIAMLTRQRN
jgi:glycosyltransferase involved in cell wall biosynthesis